MASKRNVKFIQPEVPSFLKKFKERVGYKEPANINDKFSHNVENSEDKSGGESDVRQVGDEQPVIVVLKEGDMTAEEVERHKKENRSTVTWDNENDKPVFKKPVKRPGTETDAKKGGKKKKPNVNVKAVKNSKLLSFDDNEDEDS